MNFISRLGSLLAVSLIFLPLSILHSYADDLNMFTIGTGGTDYTYHPVGGMIANAISNPPGSLSCEKGGSCGVENLVAMSISSLGSIDNVRAVLNHKRNSGFVQSDVAYWMYTGTGIMQGEEPQVRLRAIAALYEEHVQLVVLKESGIKTITDLRGKRIAVDEQGSGTYVDATLILEASGVYDEDYEAFDLRGREASAALRAGEIDAFFVVAGYPTDLIADLANMVDIRLVPIDGAAADALTAEYGFFAINDIPSGTYKGVDDLLTLSVGAIWVTSSKENEELIYNITRSLWNEKTRKLLDVGHARGKDITLETSLIGIGVPLHKGAERFYEEAGLFQ